MSQQQHDHEAKHSLFARILTALSMVCFRQPRKTLLACAILVVASLVYSHNNLRLRMDWTYLFYPDEPIVLAGQQARDVFPLPGDIAVLVDRGTEAQRKQYIDRLAARLDDEPKLFQHIFYRFDLKPLAGKALYYLDETTLKQLADGLDSINSGSTDSAKGGTGRRIFLKLLADLDSALKTRGRATYIPIWQVLAKEQGEETANTLASLMRGEEYVYPTIGNGRINVLLTKAGTRGNTFANSGPLIDRLRTILDELSPTATGLRIRLTGLPVMLHDERNTAASDGTVSTVISVVLCVLGFAIGFGEATRPMLATLALATGMAWTAGFTALAVGHLNFISVSLATMLTGIGIDFGIHFIFRYDEEMSLKKSPAEAIAATLASNGVDTMVGAVATATAFLALTQAHFRGISDFAVVAAGGTMLTFLSTIIVLPALLALVPGKGRGKAGTSKEVAWMERLFLHNAGTVTILGLLGLVGAGMLATRVGFNYNLLSVQAQELSSVRTELDMINEFKSTVLSAESIDKGEAQARARMKAYEKLPTVARVGSILPLLPERTPEKQALVERITGRVAELELPPRVELETAEDLLAVERRVKEMEATMPPTEDDPEVSTAINSLKRFVRGMDPGPIQDGLSVFQEEVRSDLSTTLTFLRKQRDVAPTLDDIPSEMRLRYLSPDGHFRQTVQPVKNIWERENLEPFLKEIKSVDPTIMGHPVVQTQILGAFERTLERTPLYTLAGVLLVLGLHLRSLSAIFISLLPSAAGLLVIFAVMASAKMQFNVVNFVGLPISVGLGAVYGVHALHRMKEDDDERLLTCSTGPALFLSGMTTIIGFASLIPAQHRGISSLGFVISVGVAVNFLGSMFYLPSLRRVIRRRSFRKAILSLEEWPPKSEATAPEGQVEGDQVEPDEDSPQPHAS